MLLRGAALRPERLELDRGRLPPAEAVVGEAEELPHGLRGGRGIGERTEDLARLLEALSLERPAGVSQTLLRLLDGPTGDRLPERGVGRELVVVRGRAPRLGPAGPGG